MELKVKKAKIGTEKLASMYSEALGIDSQELVDLAKKKAAEKSIPEDEALYEVVREKGKMSAIICPLSNWVPQSRAGDAGGFALVCVAAVIDENGKIDVRTVRAYPDDEAQLEAVQSVGAGIVAKPDTVWKMTGRDTQAEIKDDSGQGIIGVKALTVLEDNAEFTTDEVAEAISAAYKEKFGITGSALENYNKSIAAEKEDGSLFDAVVATISSFEIADIMIMSDLRIPRKREEGQAELKPRLDAIGIFQRRGETRHNEFALYYDSEQEALNAKSEMTPPLIGTSHSVFELRRIDPDTQESIPMIDALGNNKIGIRGLIIDSQGEKVVEKYKESYVNVLDMCDEGHGDYVPPVEYEQNQKVEFYSQLLAPFAMINAVASSVDETTKNPVLRMVITDGKRTILANMYGQSALALVGADSPESFKDAVTRYHNAVMKNVQFFGARTSRFDDTLEQNVFYITMNSVHAQIEPEDSELEAVFSAAEETDVAPDAAPVE